MEEDKEEMENVMCEKFIVERRFIEEITPVQAILPLVMEEFERKRKKYMEEHLGDFKNKLQIKNIVNVKANMAYFFALKTGRRVNGKEKRERHYYC